MGRIADETLRGFKWTFLQKLTLQPAQFVFSIVLAHLISPREMGILGLTSIFFAIAGTLASAGFGSALVRKLDRTEEDCSTMFWFNVGMSFLMSACLFAAAPWFVSFFNQPELLWLTRASAVMMFFGSTGGVHWCLYTCRRDFKTPSIVNGAITLISMPVCLYLAYIGWGVWALMTQQILSSVLNLVTVWIISPWRPRFIWSNKSFKTMFAFGSRMAASGLLDTTFNKLSTFFIGKCYSPEQLGLYSRGMGITNLPVNLILSNINSVAYPVLATIQNDDVRLIAAYRKYIKVLSFFIFFGVLLMAALSQPLVRVLYGAQWMGCVIFTQILCFSMIFWHLHVVNLAILQVKGRSDLFLRLEIIKKCICLIPLVAVIWFSVETMCWASCVVTQLCLFVNTYYTGKLFDYSYKKQWGDFLPYLLKAALCALPAWGVTFLPIHAFFQLALGGTLSCALYWAWMHFTHNEAYGDVLRLMEERGVFTKLQRFCFWKKSTSAS